MCRFRADTSERRGGASPYVNAKLADTCTWDKPHCSPLSVSVYPLLLYIFSGERGITIPGWRPYTHMQALAEPMLGISLRYAKHRTPSRENQFTEGTALVSPSVFLFGLEKRVCLALPEVGFMCTHRASARLIRVSKTGLTRSPMARGI